MRKIFLISLVLIACKARDVSSDRTELPAPPPPPPHILVTSSQDSSVFAVVMSDRRNGGRPFEMSEKDIADVEKIFNRCLQEYNQDNPQGPYKLESKNYKRQYVPMLNSKGEKEVWVNCFCETRGDEWKTKIVSVDDGGDCYFNLRINLSTRSYYDLMINGEA